MGDDVASKEEARLLRTMNRIATGGKVTPIQFNNESSSEPELISPVSKGLSTASGKSMTSTWRLKQEEAKKMREEFEQQEKMKKERIIKNIVKSSSVPTSENPERNTMQTSNSEEKPKEDPANSILYSPRSPRYYRSQSNTPSPSSKDPLASFVSGLIRKEEERLSSSSLDLSPRNKFNSIGNRGDSQYSPRKEPIKIVNSFEEKKENSTTVPEDKTPSFVKNIWSPNPSTNQSTSEEASTNNKNTHEERKEDSTNFFVEKDSPIEPKTSNEDTVENINTNEKNEESVIEPSLNVDSVKEELNGPSEKAENSNKENTNEEAKNLDSASQNTNEIESSDVKNEERPNVEVKEVENTKEEQQTAPSEEKVSIQESTSTQSQQAQSEVETTKVEVKQEQQEDQVVRSIIAQARAVISSVSVASPEQFSKSLYEENSRTLIAEFAKHLDVLGYSDSQKKELVALLRSLAKSGKVFVSEINPQISIDTFNERSLPVKNQIKEILFFIKRAKESNAQRLETENKTGEMDKCFGQVSFKVVEMVKMLQQPTYDKQQSTSKVQELITFIKNSITPYIRVDSQKNQLLYQLKSLLQAGIEMNLVDGEFSKRNDFVQQLKGTLQSIVEIKRQIHKS